jgi:hypothetical protein
MVNTLATMHNLKGRHIDFTQAFPQAKLKEDIYLRFTAGFEHKHKKVTGFSSSAQYMRDSDLNNQNPIHAYSSEKT